MRVLTSSGSIVPVRQRYNFVGTDFMSGGMLGWSTPPGMSQWSQGAELISGPGGRRIFANFYDIYRTNPWVFACVNLISWGLARLPLRVYEVDADGNLNEIRGDVPTTPGRNTAAQNLARVLDRPQPRRSKIAMFRKLAADFLISGNGLLEKQYSNTGLSGLVQRPWRRINVVLSENDIDEEPVLYYELMPRGMTSGDTGSRKLIPEDVVHLDVGNDPEWPIGISPITSMKSTIALYNAIQRHLVAFFGNQARTSGHLKMEKGTKREVLAFVREELAQLYASPENAGRPIVTSGEWQSISTSPEHSSIVELAKESRLEVAAGYGVPPPLIGILDRAIMGNVRELRSHHLRDVIGPWAVLFEDSLEAQLMPDSPSLANNTLAFDMGAALRPDFEALAAALRDFASTASLNERRKIVDLPKIDHPDADAVFVPLNESPIGDKTPDDGGEDPGGQDPSSASGNGHRKRSYVRIASRSV